MKMRRRQIIGAFHAPYGPLTATGQIMGTPQYMAPEQIEHPLQVDHRADIYSLGVVFYQMLTGELPIGRFAPPSKKVQIDVRLDEVVLRALEKEPERRYQQASEMKTRVETIATTPADVGCVKRTDESESSAALGALHAPDKTSNAAAIEEARRQVKGPAIGLLVTGILNWVAIPLVALVVVLVMPMMQAQGQPGNLLAFVPISAMFIGSLLIFAALKMKRLQAYGLAIAASILAIIISPGNVIGLPIGIWALVVLSQRDVRAAFRQKRNTQGESGMMQEPQQTRTFLHRVLIGLVSLILVGSVAFLALPQGGLLRWWSAPSAPQQEWHATTATTAPAIDCVLIGGREAIVEGIASTDSRIRFEVGKRSYTSCGFLKNARFTATLTPALWIRGLDIHVVDAEGNVLLRFNGQLGPMQSQPGQIIFRESPLKPEPDGSFVVAEYRPETGPPLPIAVRLEKVGGAGASAGEVQKIKTFDTAAKLIAKDGIAVDQNAWRIEAKGKADVYKEPQRLANNEKYEKMTPLETARAFFQACAKEDWDEVGKFYQPLNDDMKRYLGGLELVHLGEPLKSKGYPGWIVPYEIKFKDGNTKSWNLAVRNDNPAKRYLVDGGL